MTFKKTLTLLALGASLVAAGAAFAGPEAGHPNIIAARAMTRVERTFEPDGRNAALYDELYEQVYQKMYPRLAPLYARIRAITGYPARD